MNKLILKTTLIMLVTLLNIALTIAISCPVTPLPITCGCNADINGATYIQTGQINCKGQIIQIKADNIVFFCDGFQATYNNPAGGGIIGVGYGIDATYNHKNALITNCNIVESTSTAFHYGIAFLGQKNTTIQNTQVTTIGTSTGQLYMADSHNNTIKNNYFHGTGISVQVWGFSNSKNNHFINNRLNATGGGAFSDNTANDTNRITYLNSFGNITWKKWPLSTNGYVNLGETILISKNHAGITSAITGALNNTATITLYNTGQNSLLQKPRQIWEDTNFDNIPDTHCLTCNILKNTSDNYTIQVQHFSAYGIANITQTTNNVNPTKTNTQEENIMNDIQKPFATLGNKLNILTTIIIAIILITIIGGILYYIKTNKID